MYLARDKYGRLGRKMGEFGDPSSTTTPQAVIQAPTCAERTSTVYVNPNQIQADQDYWDQVDQATATAQSQNDAASQSAEDIANSVWYKQAQEINAFQNNIPENADDAAIKNYLASCVGTPQSLAVAKSISPEFNLNRLVPGQTFQTPTHNANADFNEFQLMGNPLTRDGQYGVVTDWDRFVQGHEMEQAEVQDPSAMNGNNSTILYKTPGSFGRGRFGHMGDDGDDNPDAQDVTDEIAIQPTDAVAATPVAPTPTQTAAATAAAPQGSSINWTQILTGAEVGLTAAAVKASGGSSAPRPAGAAVPSVATASIGGIPSVVVYGLVGVAALGIGLFILKKMKKT